MAWDGAGTETLTVSRERDGSAPGGPVWAMDGSGAMGTVGGAMTGCGTTGGRPALSPASWPKPAYCAVRAPAGGAVAPPAPLGNTWGTGADAGRLGKPAHILSGRRRPPATR